MFSERVDIKNKLYDPLIAQPLLFLISEYSKHNIPSILWLRDHAFNSDVINHLLHNAPSLRTKLFMNLPTANFLHCKNWLEENWPQLNEVSARWGAGVYSQISPDRAAVDFQRYIEKSEFVFNETDDLHNTHPKLTGILSAISYLPIEHAVPLIDNMIKKINPDKLHLHDENELIKMAWTFQHDGLADVITGQMIETNPGKLFEIIFKCITQESSWLEYMDALFYGDTNTNLKDIKPLFDDSFNAETFDQYLKEDNLEFKVIEDLFKNIPETSNIITFTKKIMGTLLTKANLEEHQGVVLIFGIALHAFLQSKNRLNLQQMSLEDTIKYASVRPVIDAFSNELIQHLSLFQKEAVITALITQFEEDQDEFNMEAENLAIVMGKLGCHEFIYPLISAIEKNTPYDLSDYIADALIDIGKSAQEYIIEHWDNLNDTQKIYSRSVLGAISGHKTTDFILRHFEYLFDDDEEALSSLIMSTPDARYIPLLENVLSNYIPLIDHSFYFVCKMVDYAHPELENACQRVMEYENHIEARLNNPSFLDKRTLHLNLQCPECMQIKYYDISKVYCFSHDDLQPVIPGEHTCKHCHKVTTLLCTHFSETIIWRTVMNEIRYDDDNNKAYEIAFAQAQLRNGQITSIRESLNYYEHRIVTHPQSAIEWLCLGNTYSNIGYFQKALQAYQHCWEQNKSFVEAIYSSAEILDRQGKSSAAMELLQEALAYQSHWKFYRLLDKPSPAKYAADFSRFYNLLRDKLQLTHIPPLSSSFLGNVENLNISKMGRNDTCHCGSGKKYKKCCLLN